MGSGKGEEDFNPKEKLRMEPLATKKITSINLRVQS